MGGEQRRANDNVHISLKKKFQRQQSLSPVYMHVWSGWVRFLSITIFFLLILFFCSERGLHDNTPYKVAYFVVYLNERAVVLFSLYKKDERAQMRGDQHRRAFVPARPLPDVARVEHTCNRTRRVWQWILGLQLPMPSAPRSASHYV